MICVSRFDVIFAVCTKMIFFMICGSKLFLLFVIYMLYLEGNKLDGTIPAGCWPMSGFLFDVRYLGGSEPRCKPQSHRDQLLNRLLFQQTLAGSSAYFIWSNKASNSWETDQSCSGNSEEAKRMLIMKCMMHFYLNKMGYEYISFCHVLFTRWTIFGIYCAV